VALWVVTVVFVDCAEVSDLDSATDAVAVIVVVVVVG
jgi:hypothetical protein